MHLFGRTALPPILEVTLGAKTALYNATIQAEDKVKKSHVPPMLEVTRAEGADTSIALTFQRAMVVTARALSRFSSVTISNLAHIPESYSEAASRLVHSCYNRKSLKSEKVKVLSICGSRKIKRMLTHCISTSPGR